MLAEYDFVVKGEHDSSKVLDDTRRVSTEKAHVQYTSALAKYTLVRKISCHGIG